MPHRLDHAIAGLLLFTAAAAAPAPAADFTVNSELDFADPDPGDGRCGVLRTDGTFLCSLRAAIQEANIQTGEPHRIVLDEGRYRLLIRGRGEDAGALGDLDVRRHVRITGEGPLPSLCRALPGTRRPVEIPASGIWEGVPLRFAAGCRPRASLVGAPERGTIVDAAGLDRAFDVHPGGRLELEGLAVIHGNPQGTLPEVTQGGAIRSNGAVSLVDVAIRGNRAGIGGGIFSEGDLSITESAVLSNEATAETSGLPGCGGGIASTGLLTVDAAAVANNRAAGNGGGICAEPRANNPFVIGRDRAVRIERSIIWRNRAARGGGGLSLTNESGHSLLFASSIIATIVGLNTALEGGGGIELRRSPPSNQFLVIERSYVVGNSAAGIRAAPPPTIERDRGGDGGGVHLRAGAWISYSVIRGNGASGNGGGLHFDAEPASNPVDSQTGLLFSEVSLNRARGEGGGMWSRGASLALDSSTVSGNEARVRGGGLYLAGLATERPEIGIRYATLAANIAPEGSALFAARADRRMEATIVAGGDSPNCAISDSPLIGRYNLEDQNTCGFGAASFVMVDPVLGTLQDNGGPTPTRTHALLDGSPALDVIPCAVEEDEAPSTDQRLVPRPQNGLCDVGAYEREAFPSWALDCCFEILVGLFDTTSTLVATAAEFHLAMIELKNPAGIQLGEAIFAQSTGLAGALREAVQSGDPQGARGLLENASTEAAGIEGTLDHIEVCCATIVPDLAGRLRLALEDVQSAIASALAGADRGVLLRELASLLEGVEAADLPPGLKNSLSRRLTGAEEALAGGEIEKAIAALSGFIEHAESVATAGRRATLAALISTATEIRERLAGLRPL